MARQIEADHDLGRGRGEAVEFAPIGEPAEGKTGAGQDQQRRQAGRIGPPKIGSTGRPGAHRRPAGRLMAGLVPTFAESRYIALSLSIGFTQKFVTMPRVTNFCDPILPSVGLALGVEGQAMDQVEARAS